MLSTQLTREWGLRHPLVPAPMAGVSGGQPAAAAAGGLGLIGVGESATTGWLDRAAAEASAADGVWGFGCVAWVLQRHPGLLRQARAADDFDICHVYVGQEIGLIRAVEPAGAIIGRLAAEAEGAIRRSGTLLGPDS